MAKSEAAAKTPEEQQDGDEQKHLVAGRPQFKAVCPRNESHPGARVYRTVGRKRYCKCNTCGAQWTGGGPPADPLRDYVGDYCDRLETAIKTPTTVDKVPCLLTPVADAQRLVRKLRELASAES